MGSPGQMRTVTCRHQEALSEEGVTSMIDGFDRQQIGGVQPGRRQTKGAAKQVHYVPDAISGESSAPRESEEAGPHTHVQVCGVPVLGWIAHLHSTVHSPCPMLGSLEHVHTNLPCTCKYLRANGSVNLSQCVTGLLLHRQCVGKTT